LEKLLKNQAGSLVLTRLIEGCSALGDHAGSFLKTLQDTLCFQYGKIQNPNSLNSGLRTSDLLMVGLCQKTVSNHFSSSGLSIVKALLKLPAILVQTPGGSPYVHTVGEGLVSLDPMLLSELASHFLGSRVVETFFESEVPLNLKSDLVEKLKEHCTSLATSKFGSFCLEKCFEYGTIAQMKKLAMELVKGEARLASNLSGITILRKLRIDLLKRKPQEWMKWITLNRSRKIREQNKLVSKNGPNSDKPIPKEKEKAKVKKTVCGKKRKRRQQSLVGFYPMSPMFLSNLFFRRPRS